MRAECGSGYNARILIRSSTAESLTGACVHRVRRYIEDFDTTDQVTRWIAFAALMVLLVAMLPRVWPPAFSEVNCNNLSSPTLGGDHQSLLALQTPPSDLVLDMSFDRDTINVGDPLGMT